jgi:hypothetical protein
MWSPPGAFSSLFNTFWVWYCEHSLKISSTKPSWMCEWVRTHLLICVCVCVSERELTSLPPFRPIKRRTNLANRISDGRTHTETLNPKPGHTQEDTHYTEWYPLRTHPRGYPLHWVIPWHWVIPITDTPKRIPITLSDTDTLSDFSSHWEFSQPTQEFTHDIEGPWFPHKQTGHWVIPITLRDTPNTKLYPLPWVPANRIPDGRTDPLHWGIPLTLSYTHYPEFQPKDTGRMDRLITLRDTPDTELYPLPWVPANRIPDGRTDAQTHAHHVCNYI